jgi:hypothetical protein
MPMKSLTFGLLVAACVAAPLSAQTLNDVKTKQQAVLAAWDGTPLTLRRAIFVARKPELYGDYDERKSNAFKPGEPLITYLEPVGYTWKSVDDGKYQFGVSADVIIKTPDGKIIGGKDKFLDAVQKSRNKVQELMVNLTLTLTGTPPGDYIITYTLHHANSDKSASFSQPFKIAE